MAIKRKLTDQIFGAEEDSAAKMDPEKLRGFQKIAARMYHTPQLSAKDIAMPAFARVGRQISNKIQDNYSTFFYLSALRIDMIYIAVIQALIGVYDTLNNPLMGIVYDKTRTRWGKARPYAFLAPLFYFSSTAVLFSGGLFFNNADTKDPNKILFVFVMLFIRETFSTLYGIPNDNFTSLMSPNPRDRINIGLYQTYAEKWSGDFLVAGILVPLLNASKDGLIKASPAIIYTIFGIVGAVAGTSGSMLMSVNCRERLVLQPKPAATSKTLFYILKNKYAMRNFVAGFATSWWNKSSMNWDVITQLEIWGGVIRTVPWMLPRQIMQFVSLGLVERFKKMFGGSFRKTVIFMRIWDMLLCSMPALIGLSPKVIGSWWKAGLTYAVFDALVVSNDAPSNVLEGEINREISDYTEYMTGERPDGTIGLLTDLIGRVMTPFSTLWTIAVIKWVGYDPNIGSTKKWTQALVQDNSIMYSRGFFMYSFANIVPDVVRMLPLFFYDLEGKKKEDMYIALNERRALIANNNTLPEEMEAMIEMMAEKEMAEGKV